MKQILIDSGINIIPNVPNENPTIIKVNWTINNSQNKRYFKSSSQFKMIIHIPKIKKINEMAVTTTSSKKPKGVNKTWSIIIIQLIKKEKNLK